ALPANATSYPRRANAFRRASRNGSSSSTMRRRAIRGVLSARFRHRQGDLGPSALGGHDPHLASLALEHVPGEIEAKTRAAPRLLGGEERLADATEERLGHSDPVVGHLDPQLSATPRKPDAHFPGGAVLGRLGGVV